MKHSSFRKFTASVSALALLVTSVFTFGVRTTTAATTFTDAGRIATWASDSVTALVDSGVLTGRPDGSFDPQGTLNRAELAKVAQLGGGLTTDTTGAPHFNDVSPSDWYYDFVETLYNNGVVGGINGGALDANGLATYNPGGTVNRAEGAKVLTDAFDLETSYAGTPPNFSDVASNAWFFDSVETAYAHGILNGYDDGTFGPADPITREQVAVVAQNSVVESADGSKRRSTYTAGAASTAETETGGGTETETGGGTVATTSDGTLGVALSASNPAGQTVPAGASSISVLDFDLTASSTDDVTMTSLQLVKTGISATTSISNVYLYDGADRLTTGRTITSTDSTVNFNSLSIAVSAGTTKTITVKIDTASSVTSGDSYGFEINSADAISSNGQGISGTFPIAGNMFTASSTAAGTITIASSGSITAPKVGEKDVNISKFQLTAGSAEGANVEQIALIIGGTISAEAVQNAKLYQGGVELASVAAANTKDLLVFTLDTPYLISKGDSRNFDVKADLNTGRTGDTINVYVDETTDVVATGDKYGFGLAVTSTLTTGSQTVTLLGGDITISSSGPSATNIAVNGKDIPLMNFNITANSEATFRQLEISLTPTENTANAGLVNSTTANYTDIKIVNTATGTTLMGPIDSTSLVTATGGSTAITEAAGDNAVAYYVFTDEFTMMTGDSLDLAITADVANNSALATDTLVAGINITASYPQIRDTNNKTVTNSSSVVPSSAIAGKTMTVQAASLTIALSSSVVSDTFVKGTTGVCYAGFSLAAGDASDIKITSLKTDGGSDADGAGWTQAASGVKDLVGSVKLYDGATQIGTAESVQTDGSATFDNLTYTIAAGSTKLLKVCGDITSSISSGSRGVAFAIAAAANVVAEDDDGNTVTPTGTASLVATTPSVIMTVTQGGSLTVAVDASTAKENIAVAGTAGVDISKFKFTTTDESFIVKKLSINNRQSAVATANLGDYDNNVTAITISYTNSAGATETKTGYLTSGTASFSGLDMFVDKDDDAVLTVTADLNTISSGAAAAEFVDLNLAFNNFEAVAQGSGETYTGGKLDDTIGATSDLDIGTITFTDPGTIAVGTGDTGVSAGVADIIATADLNVTLPVGTLVKFGAASTTYLEASEPLMVLTTSYTDGDLTLTGVILNDDSDATSIVNTDEVWYALPGTGYLTAANQMHIYESKPTVALSSSSPSGSRTVSASDNIFVFTVSADSQEKVQIRAGVELTSSDGFDSAGGNNAANAADTGTADNVDGSAVFAALDNFLATDSVSLVSAEDLSGYARVNFWFKYTGAAVPTFAALKYNVTASSTADPADGNEIALSQTLCGADAASPATTEWYNCDVAISTQNAASDTFFHFEIDDSTGLTFASDELHLDRVIAYNEKLTVSIATDTDIDTYANNTTNAGGPVAALLQEGGTTVATAYVDSITNGASAAATGQVVFIPTTAIEVSKGTTKTFTVQTDTSDLLAEDAASDDPVTVSFDLGTSSGGTVTAGDFWWNETNATVKWVGQVTNTTLNGSTLQY